MTALSIALISFLLLALQIVLMQAVGYAQGHHLAYVILSIALLGFGAGGSVLTLLRKRSRTSLEAFYAPALLLCALSTAWLPFPARALLVGLEVDLLFTSHSQWLRLAGLGGVMLLPFFFGAAALSIAFSTRPEGIGKLYAANLIGSAAGAGTMLLALRWSLPENMMPLLALPALLAAIPARPRKMMLVMTMLGIFAAAALEPALPRSPYKALSTALQLPDAQRTGPLPHPLGRVDVVKAPALRYAPDLSLHYTGPVPSPPHLFIDGETAGVLLNKEDPSALILAETPRALPFPLGPVTSALLLSPGGTPYSHLAQAHNAAITLVEPHPRIVERIRPLLPDSARLVTSDPRRFLSQSNLPPYALIVFPVRGLFGGPSGLYTLGEDSLFTVEAVSRAFSHLTPGGHLAFNVWLDEPVRHALRITDLAVTALKSQGIPYPAKHIVIVRGWGSMSLLAGRQPFNEEAMQHIESFTDSKGFDLLWPPDRIKRRHGTAGDGFDQMLTELMGPNPEILHRTYRFDIRAPTDDRPFFNQFLRLSDRGADLDFLSVSERGLLILLTMLYLLMAAVLILVFGPLLPLHISPLRQPFTLFYFTGLGAGFMLFEVALIQRLMPLWGSTLTSAALVIAALLCGMGIGSIVSRKCPPLPRFAAGIAAGIAVLTVSTLLVLDIVIGWLMSAPASVQTVSLLLLLLLPAIPLGIPFPLGVRFLARHDVRQIPWACGIDGAVAVLAAPSAALLAFQTGYASLTFAVGGAYLLASAGALLARPNNYASSGNG